MKKYFDCEYSREVTEEYVLNQYNWFKSNCSWFAQTYEKFLKENFQELGENNTPFYGIGL